MATDGDDPRAPHWFDFNKVNDLPNEWRFDVLNWDDDPDEDVVDRGEAKITDGEHLLVIVTWLVERDRTHDRYYSVAYETINQDGEPEPLAFYLGSTSSIARNNAGHARDCLEADDGEPHVLVRHHDHGDGERETFEFPNEYLAEEAADLQVRLKLDHDDRDYLVNVFPKDEWEQRLETERELGAASGGGRDV